jgi:general secretion pathway protein G
LIEIMVVVVILAILAMIVVPQFTSAAAETRTNSIKMDVHRIRTQLQLYQQQHGGLWPTLAEIEAQLTTASDRDGQTAAPGTDGFDLGPYMREIPKNPNVGENTVGDGAVGSSAWYYDETTGDFRANDSAATRAF